MDRVWRVLAGNPVQEERAPSEDELRRRRIAAVVTLVGGAVGLAALLRLPSDSGWFPVAALALGAWWALGGLAGGPLRLGHEAAAAGVGRPWLRPVLVGLGLAAVFVVGALVALQMPFLADQVRSVLSFTDAAPLPVIAVVTLLSGAGEEVFFRGGLYAAVKPAQQIWLTTILYAAATAASGNPMLGFAALLLGWITAHQRRATGGILAPVLTHATWSAMMLLVLPQVF